MAISKASNLLQFFFLACLCGNSLQVKPDDEEEALFEGINSYRRSLNLTEFSKNDNAKCFAEEIADQFKRQSCSKATGSNTVPGTETQLNNYESLASNCKLNVADTREGAIMPACVPNLDQALVLSNFTKTQYTQSLNDTKFTGIGVGSDENWIVVILTTTTPGGSFAIATSSSDESAPGIRINLTSSSSLASFILRFCVFACFILQ